MHNISEQLRGVMHCRTQFARNKKIDTMIETKSLLLTRGQ